MDAVSVIAAQEDSRDNRSDCRGDDRPAAILRGNARGLEIVVQARAGTDAIVASIMTRLAEAPGFFRGCDVRVRVEDGPLASDCFGRLADIADRFELRIVEIGARPLVPPVLATIPLAQELLPPIPPIPAMPPIPPIPQRVAVPAEIPALPSPDQLELALRALEPEIEVVEEEEPPAPRVVVGPIRSGVIFEHRGHVIVFGDVNPGAEIRAEGNIVVLGRLRGTAHAAIGRDAGFILALRLEPQQLRISRMVARASDSDKPGSVPEIAHITGGNIVVERYQGRLPGGLAHSI